MRETKFRGQKSETKEWVYGSLVSSKTNPVAIIQQKENPIFQGEATGWCFGIIAETVGQFTGLQDKNGKDVYEGDIVKIDDNHPLEYAVGSASSDNISHHKIYWDNERAMFWDTRLEDGDSLAGYCDGDISFIVEGRIIGNIYDNPELLP